MRLSDFDYELPRELIAQHPLPDRAASRLLVVERHTGACELRAFGDFPRLIRPGDCVVVNDTRVIPARLFGRRTGSGGRVEFLLLHALNSHPGHWEAMLRPGRRLRPGATVALDGTDGTIATIEERLPDGTCRVSFGAADVLRLAEQAGRVPLPPYITREPEAADRDRYQTVYAATPGAVAAPTAGLHFTPDILMAVKAAGATVVSLTLHVGPGTFLPVKSEDPTAHVMHAEYYDLPPATAATVNAAKAAGNRVIAIGTTSVRVLETCADGDTGRVRPGSGWTRLFLYPPMQPKVTDCLLTNFHLPCSTLLMLVSTFSSLENIRNAYALAVRERLRFFSYGDCMFLQ